MSSYCMFLACFGPIKHARQCETKVEHKLMHRLFEQVFGRYASGTLSLGQVGTYEQLLLH